MTAASRPAPEPGDGGGDARLRAEVERLESLLLAEGRRVHALAAGRQDWRHAAEVVGRRLLRVIGIARGWRKRATAAERALAEARDARAGPVGVVMTEAEVMAARAEWFRINPTRRISEGTVRRMLWAAAEVRAAQLAGSARGQDGAATSAPVCQVWETDCVAADPAEPGRAGVRRAAIEEAAQRAVEAWLKDEPGSDIFPDAMGDLKDALALDDTEHQP